MLFLAALLLALVTAPLLGGRLGRLADLDPRGLWSVFLAIGLQILIISVFPDRFEFLHVPIHIVSYLFAGYFVWANRDVPGVWLIGVGALLNFAAISANGGIMPASPEALEVAGSLEDEGEFVNSRPVDDPKLLFLGDVFAIPRSVPLLNNVFSVGDVFICVGVLLLIHGVAGSRLLRATPLRRLAQPFGTPTADPSPRDP